MSHPVSIAPERRQRLQTLLKQAMELDLASRVTLVTNECGDDVHLREQLLSLVSGNNIDADFERQIDAAIAAAAQGDAELQPGQLIGRYKVLRLIGRGGMGAVYLAERADKEYEQQVAIKIVSDSAMSTRIVARLRIERQILANLNHPNIARLIDGGATGEGTPYLVMEYVAGQRIDDYCKHKQLGIAAKLDLFKQVCTAVQCAHQQLIIHRDIKPTNILVTDDGTVKLLDFGIAKLIDPHSTQGPDLTQVHERVLTPEFASPEQMRGEPVGTASDIYALGILLYELLSHSRPFDLFGLAYSHVEKIICEQLPIKPSDKANDPMLRGDLDTIVLKALHKETNRRYASASALADDIDNYLNNRPITARPDSAAYRAGKFWRRNRWALSSAAAMLVAVIALTVFYTWRLIHERDIAEQQRQTAEAVSKFMQDVFEQAEPDEERGNKVTVRETLDAAVKRIDNELIAQPRVRADLLYTMTRAYSSLGLWRESLELSKKLVALETDSFGSNHEGLMKALETQGSVYFVLNQFDNALDAYDKAQEIRERIGLTANADGVELITSRANVLRMLGRNDEALEGITQGKAMLAKLSNVDSQRLAGLLQVSAAIQLNRGEWKKAESDAQAALKAIEASTADDKRDLRENVLDTLAQALRRLSQLAEAERIYRELLTRQLARFDADAPLIARTRNNLSNVLTALGDYQHSEAELRQAIAIFDKRLGTENLDSATGYHNLGAVLSEAGRLKESEKALLRAYELRSKIDGPKSPLLFSTLIALASIATDQDHLSLAKERLALATAIAQEKIQTDDPRCAALQLTQTKLFIASKDWAQADAAIHKALSMLKRTDTKNFSQGQYWLGELAIRRGRPCDAQEPLKASLEARKASLPQGHWLIANTENILAFSLVSCGDHSLGLQLFNQSLQLLQRSRPSDDVTLRLAIERSQLVAKLTKQPAPASTVP